MTLENIINEFDKKVQAYKDKDETFEVFIKILLEEYVDKISSTVDLLNGIDPKYYPYVIPFQRNLVKDIRILSEGILKTISYCLSESSIDGNAYNTFISTILPIEKKITTRTVLRTTNFYRLRPIKTKDTILTRKELFHIPFEKRGIVSTNRYSLPGYPCLYLANSIFVAWKELLKEKQVNVGWFAVTKFNNTNISPLRFLEIDSKSFKDRVFYDKIERFTDLFNYTLLFPLIAACSLKVKENDRDNTFKPEYIISQLLLEYVRKNPDLDGIKYRSTRVDDEKVNAWNYAIPPKHIANIGYCPVLKNFFLISEIENFNFSEPHKLDPNWISKKHPDIFEIILDGKNYEFEKTFFAQAECRLDARDLEMDF